jgi:hypothetical protein
MKPGPGGVQVGLVESQEAIRFPCQAARALVSPSLSASAKRLYKASMSGMRWIGLEPVAESPARCGAAAWIVILAY